MDDIKISLDGIQEVDDRPIYELVVRTPELIVSQVIVPHDTLDKLNSDKKYKSYTFVTLVDGKEEEVEIPSENIVDYFPSEIFEINWNTVGEWFI